MATDPTKSAHKTFNFIDHQINPNHKHNKNCMPNNKMKEEILEEFDTEFETKIGSKKTVDDIKNFISKSIDQYAEEAYRKGYTDGKNNQPYGINL